MPADWYWMFMFEVCQFGQTHHSHWVLWRSHNSSHLVALYCQFDLFKVLNFESRIYRELKLQCANYNLCLKWELLPSTSTMSSLTASIWTVVTLPAKECFSPARSPISREPAEAILQNLHRIPTPVQLAGSSPSNSGGAAWPWLGRMSKKRRQRKGSISHVDLQLGSKLSPCILVLKVIWFTRMEM